MDEERKGPPATARRRGLVLFCFTHIATVFVVIGIVDFLLMDRDWNRLRAELPENLLVAVVAGLIFSAIDWRRNQQRSGEGD